MKTYLLIISRLMPTICLRFGKRKIVLIILEAEITDGTLVEFEVDDDQEEVYLERCDILRIDLTPLSSLDVLVKLDLIGNAIEKLDLSPLSSCHNLQFLWIKDNDLDAINLSPLSSCPSLRELSITGNAVREVDLTPLQTCRQLELLGLGANRFKHVGLEPLRSMGKLDVLYLYDNRLQTIDLDPLSSCHKFRELELYHNDLTEIDLRPLSGCAELNRLDVSTNQLPAIDLSPLSSCPKLSKLNLSYNMLDTIDLGPLSMCSGLDALAINNNRLSELDLSPLVRCTELLQLFLQDNTLRRLDLTPLALANGLSSSSWETRFFMDSFVPWIETLFSKDNFWSVYSETPLSIRYDAPVFISDLAVISQVLNKVIQSEPAWKMTHLLHNTLSLLGLDWLGMVDTDAGSLLTEYFAGQEQAILEEMVISRVSEQIDSGSTTIGLDAQRLSEHPELAVKSDRVLDLRRREIEQVRVVETESGLDLRPLWLTAYGYQVLSALGLGTSCGSDEKKRVQNALSERGLELGTIASGTADSVTEMSTPLREYIWHLADYRSELQRLPMWD